jgi:hypothetical protein
VAARRELCKLRSDADAEAALAEMADEVAAEAARHGSVWSLLRSAAVRSELTLGAVSWRCNVRRLVNRRVCRRSVVVDPELC